MRSSNKKTKKELIEILEKNPVIQPACDRCSINRSTFYRWQKEDKEFAKEVARASEEGRNLVSELCESKLMNAIKNENLGAIKYWLQFNDPRYSNKLEVHGHVTAVTKELTPEQEEKIKQALMLADIKIEGGNYED